MGKLFFLPKRFLGIDIGSTTIKVVELSSFAGRIKLENYGAISSKALYGKSFKGLNKNTFFLSAQEISKAIKAIFEEAKIKGNKGFFSIPDYTTFCSTFELPPMTREEIPLAVEAEARRHIPVPLDEVVWDWQIIGKSLVGTKEKFKILLVATPKEIIHQYEMIASSLGLKSISLEAEVFSLVRALVEKSEEIVGIVDIGARTTSCSIIEKGILKFSRSFDLSGDDLTERIAKSLEINEDLAEQLKITQGLNPEKGKEEIKEILMPLIDLILKEINQSFQYFLSQEGKEVERIIVAGGGANLPGLLQYFKEYLKKEVEITNPFKKIYFPPILEETLKEIGPSFAIAVGLAKRGFE